MFVIMVVWVDFINSVVDLYCDCRMPWFRLIWYLWCLLLVRQFTVAWCI